MIDFIVWINEYIYIGLSMIDLKFVYLEWWKLFKVGVKL